MPLVIETGTGTDANANSYATRAELIAYAALRGVSIADEDASDVFAIKAMDYIEVQDFKGEQTQPGVQPCAFPRTGVAVGLVAIADNEIPLALKNAQCEAALLISQGVELLSNLTAGEQSIKRDKTGPLETEYFAPPSYSAQTPRLDALLRPLLNVGFGLTAVRV